ncbi:MAG: hypothetical protein Q7J73_07775 [Dehalococcoidales bacterium]|nr:hypothetical protein [Dehalococcoidales bacterium]
MKRKNIIYIVLLLALAAITVVPFLQPAGAKISGTGTVQLLNIEGGFYGIAGDDGLNYDPTNLKKEFQQDGLHVHFEGRILTGMVNTRQWGTVIEITRIEKLP